MDSYGLNSHTMAQGTLLSPPPPPHPAPQFWFQTKNHHQQKPV